jgi:branched-subunit amino acid transport protein
MNTIALWGLFVLIGLGTFLQRLSFIFLAEKIRMPGWVQRALRFVPASVLAALVFPALTHPTGVLDLSFGNFRLLAGLAGALVAWRTRNVLLTLLAGMLVLWALQALF